MNKQTTHSVHWSFWLIALLTLIWNAAGAANFIIQLTSTDLIESYRATERTIIENRPMWITATFAIAVFGGSVGCLLLLLRRIFSIYFFIASLICTVITTLHTFTLDIEFSVGELVGIISMPIALAGFLTWYAYFAKTKNWFLK